MRIVNEFIADETEIIWLEDPLKYEYLREGNYGTTKPRQFATKPWGRRNSEEEIHIIGYAVHKPAGEITVYNRRFWYLKHYDRGSWGIPNPNYATGASCPCEAVIPSSIKVQTISTRYDGSVDHLLAKH